ncbi:MAG: 50S ribosomal protein L6 [Deltaproteobacteria bacterium]|nr:50S ribosomal protein L6 [Deltaproteobacteria bacterium]
MSRIGKKPIKIPEDVKIKYQDNLVEVSGKNGKMFRTIHPDINIEIKEGFLHVFTPKKTGKMRAMHGLYRSLLANMVTGVSIGFERILEINGIGYKAEVHGDTIVFNLGFSHPVNFKLQGSITAKTEKNLLKLFGSDKEKLGLTAALIRDLRPPEPYKGKGIKYIEEHIRRKAGKTGTK